MENQNSNIDEIFRQRLLDAEVPPPPFVWPAVELALQKRKRRVLVFALFAFGMVSAGAAWYWQSSQMLSANSGDASTPVNTYSLNSREEKDSGTDIVSSAYNSSVKMLDAHDAKLVQQDENPLGVFINTSKGEVNRTYKARPGFPRQSITALRYSASEAAVANLEQSTLRLNKGDQSETERNTGEVQAKVLADNAETLKIQPLSPISSLSAQYSQAFPPKTYRAYAHRKKPQPKLCYDFGQHPRAWLLDVYAGPSLAQRSLTSRQDDEPYLKQRLATEHRSMSMNAGLRASLMVNRNFMIRSGLQYDQITEEFEYIDPTYIKLSINNIYVNGQFVGTDTVVEYGENYLKTYNRYSMLDIPLMVGVEMRQGRSGFSINAGITANVLFQKKGVILDPLTHEPARIGGVPQDPKAIGPRTSLSEDVFRTNLGLSATASVQWYWHLRPHFRLFVEPAFRQILRPVTVNSHPVEQRYSIIDLRIGATKIF